MRGQQPTASLTPLSIAGQLSQTVLLVIDNFDSFTYNLVQYFGQLGVEQRVFRNNEITPEEARGPEPRPGAAFARARARPARRA